MMQKERKIPFTKMHGNGNDFIIIDNRAGMIHGEGLGELALSLCGRRTSIGADGLMAIENSVRHDIRMRLFNCDGSEGEMCGNGARCLARYSFWKKIAPARMTMETLAGPIKAEVEGRYATLDMGLLELASVLARQSMTLSGEDFPYSQLTVGVPHTVIFQDSNDKRSQKDLALIAKAFQANTGQFPAGTNVNFLKVRSPGELCLQTYERGVNDFTLSCGTGSVAGAVAAWVEGFITSPVEVRNPGGVNRVMIEEESPGKVRLFLKGLTTIVAEGVVFGECLQIRES